MISLSHSRHFGLAASLLVACFATHAENASVSLPYEADFESVDGYAAGQLLSDPEWNLDQELAAEIFPYGAIGTQSLGFTGDNWLWLNTLGLTEGSVTWVDFYLKPVYGETDDLPGEIQSLQSAVTGFVKVGTEGEVYAIDGDGLGGGQWLASGERNLLSGNTSQAWVRLTYRLDYTSKQWDLFVDGEMSVTDLGFLNDSVLKLTEFAARGDADEATAFDYFYAGGVNPIYVDTSNDGLPDAWLSAQGLDVLVNQRYGDPDADGLDNLTEYKNSTRADLADTDSDGANDDVELAAGIDPNNADTDSDGAQDGIELTLGIDPLDPDTDYDGSQDGPELAIGTDPSLFDTDGDGLADSLEGVWSLDPLALDAELATLNETEAGSGVFQWTQDFSAQEGFVDAALAGQQNWTAAGNVMVAAEQVEMADSITEVASFERLAGIGETRQVWVSFRARFVVGDLPDLTSSSEPVVAMWGATGQHKISVWNEAAQQWVEFACGADVTQWNDYSLYFDYEEQQWLLTQNGVLVASALPFKDDDLIVFSRFKALQGSVPGASAEWASSMASFDDFAISNVAPLGLDYDGDGLINSLEVQAGSDILVADTDGDGLGDLWEYQNGLNLLLDDTLLDADGDGLSNEDEFALGSSAQSADTDGDGFDDLDEFYAGTDLTDHTDAPDAIGLGDWQVADVGSGAGARGYTVDGLYALYAKGTGVGLNDRHGFYYQDFTGDYAIVMRVHALESGYIGLNVRGSLDESSWMTFASVYAGGTYRVHTRDENNGVLTSTPHMTKLNDFPDVYLKLERAGNRFTAYRSVDGTNWLTTADAVIDAGVNTLAGVSFASGSNAAGSRATVEVLSVVLDRDSDGISDSDEATYGTLADNADTDGDGVSDYDEIFVIFSDPLVADFDGTSTQIATVTGSSYTNSLGEWNVSGDAIYSGSLRGYVDYTVTTASAGSFRLDVTGGQNNAHSSERYFDLNLYVDGQFVGKDYIEAAYPNSGVVSFYLPYLEAGTHTIRVEWLNGESGSSLRLEQIDVLELGGADVDANGVVDWLDSHIQSVSDFDETTVSSAVSPYTIEGNAMHPAYVSIGSNYSVDPQNPEPIIIQQGLAGEYFAHIPLNPGADTQLNIQEQNGLLSFNKTVVWTPTNLLESADIILRDDDSLLLAAYSDTYNTTEPVMITVKDAQGATLATYSLTAADAVAHQFAQPGDFTVDSTLTPSTGDPLTSTVAVKVVAADFGSDPRVLLGKVRGWTVPDLSTEVVVEVDSHLSFEEVSPFNGDRRFNLSSNSTSNATVLARLGEGGPIITRATVYTLVDYSYTQTEFLIVDTFDDGTEIWSASINLGGDIPDDLSVKISIFKPGVTFLDGTIEKIITKDDLDELGVFRYYMLRPKSSLGSTCHTTTIYQGGESITASY